MVFTVSRIVKLAPYNILLILSRWINGIIGGLFNSNYNERPTNCYNCMPKYYIFIILVAVSVHDAAYLNNVSLSVGSINAGTLFVAVEYVMDQGVILPNERTFCRLSAVI